MSKEHKMAQQKIGGNLFVSVSGGLDSTALAIIISQENKEAKYIFADTGDEFPQVYEHLNKMETVLGIEIVRVKGEMTFNDFVLKKNYFPSPRFRWCTPIFKIQPIYDYLEKFNPYKLAVGLRCDETRKESDDNHIFYPLRDKNINRNKVKNICSEYGLVPQYPFYMSRGGCYSCFFKTKKEIIGLAQNEPELFQKLIDRENKVNENFNKREKSFYMFQNLGMRLEVAKKIIDAGKQVEMFNKSMVYEQTSCGLFCRK